MPGPARLWPVCRKLLIDVKIGTIIGVEAGGTSHGIGEHGLPDIAMRVGMSLQKNQVKKLVTQRRAKIRTLRDKKEGESHVMGEVEVSGDRPTPGPITPKMRIGPFRLLNSYLISCKGGISWLTLV